MSLDLEALGIFSRVHGLKGLLILKTEQVITAWESLSLIYIQDRQFGFKPIRIQNIRVEGAKNEGQSFFVQLEGIENRQEAMLLQHAKVYAESSLIESIVDETEESSWIGLTVVSTEGIPYGSVVDEQFNGDHELLLIEKSDGTTFWLPAIDEVYLIEIDEDAQEIVINDPSDLISINETNKQDED